MYLSAPLLVPLSSGTLQLLQQHPLKPPRNLLLVENSQSPESHFVTLVQALNHHPLNQPTSVQIVVHLGGTTSTVLICSGCCSKSTVKSGGLQTTDIYCSHLLPWRLEVPDEVVGRNLLQRPKFHSLGLYPHDLTTSQRPHILTLSTTLEVRISMYELQRSTDIQSINYDHYRHVGRKWGICFDAHCILVQSIYSPLVSSFYHHQPLQEHLLWPTSSSECRTKIPFIQMTAGAASSLTLKCTFGLKPSHWCQETETREKHGQECPAHR